VTVTLTKLEPHLQTLPNHAGTTLWALTVTAVVSDNQGADNNIFVYHAGASSQGDRFAAVCSAPQMRDLPALRENMTGVYYRNSAAVFLCRSSTELNDVWLKLQSDAALLARDWSKLPGATVASVVTITPVSTTPDQNTSVPASNTATVRFNADNSRALYYNAAGVLIGEVTLALPE